MNLHLTPEALRDVDGIRAYLASHGAEAEAAQATTERIAEAIAYLRRRPRIGHIGLVSETLEWSPFLMPYVIVYRIEGADVEVLRVFRHEQDRA